MYSQVAGFVNKYWIGFIHDRNFLIFSEQFTAFVHERVGTGDNRRTNIKVGSFGFQFEAGFINFAGTNDNCACGNILIKRCIWGRNLRDAFNLKITGTGYLCFYIFYANGVGRCFNIAASVTYFINPEQSNFIFTGI